MNKSFEFPSGTTDFQAIQILEKRIAESNEINKDTIMAKAELLFKLAKMICKMLVDPFYLQDQDFGPSRIQKFQKVSLLCKIYHEYFLIKQLKVQLANLNIGWQDFKTKNECELPEAELLLQKLGKIILKIENSNEDLSFNLALNILQISDISADFTCMDLLYSNHIFKMMKEKLQPQNK